MYDIDKIPSVAAVLEPFEKDCSITVALKISDTTCKMDGYEKSVFMMLFDNLQDQESEFFDNSVFQLIEDAQEQPSGKLFAKIKDEREAAMDYITRPRMKAFKASIRERIKMP